MFKTKIKEDVVASFIITHLSKPSERMLLVLGEERVKAKILHTITHLEIRTSA